MRVKIIGIGCIGGSMALRLKSNGSYEVEVYDTDEETMRMAFGMNLELSERDDPDGDLNILAVPMGVEERMLRRIDSKNLIMDVSSVMEPFVNLAKDRRLRFIGGHPMAGNERKGYRGWDPRMFEGRKFFLCKGECAEERDVELVEKVVMDLGSTPIWIEPNEHDKIVSKVSQSIFFISLVAKRIGTDYGNFAGPGYISTTRLANQNLEMVLDMVRYNGKNIVEDLRNGLNFLEEIIRLIEIEDLDGLKERMIF